MKLNMLVLAAITFFAMVGIIAAISAFSGSGAFNYGNIRLFKSRLALNIGSVEASTVGVAVSAPSNGVVDVGQYETFTATESGGVPPFSYNINVVNSVSIATIVHNDLVSGSISNSIAYTYRVTTADLSNSPEVANAAVTDVALDTGSSSYSAQLKVNPALSASISPSSNQAIDNGQHITFSAIVSGGTSPYVYQWYKGTSAACSSDSVIANSALSVYNAAPASNTYYCYTVKDSASTNNIVASPTAFVDVNPALAGAALSAISKNVDAGQTLALRAAWAGGTRPYTVNYYSGTSSACANDTVLVATHNSIYNATDSLAVAPTSTTYYCALISDSAVGTPQQSSLSAALMINVNPTLTAPSVSASNNSVTSGQSVTFSAAWSGGTPAYIAALYYSPNSTCSMYSGMVQQKTGLSANSITFNPVYPNKTAYYCVSVTDNTISPSVVGSISAGFGVPEGIAFTPNGRYAYVANYGVSNVVVVDAATNSVIGCGIIAGCTQQTKFNTPQDVAFSPSGAYAYLTSYNDITIINSSANAVVGGILGNGLDYPSGVAFTPSGAYAYVINYYQGANNSANSNVVIINTTTNKTVGAITNGFERSEGIAIAPSGSYAYVTNCNINCVRGTLLNSTLQTLTSIPDNMIIVNIQTNTVVGAITAGFNDPISVAIAPFSRYAYVVNNNGNTGNVVLVNTTTNTVTKQILSIGNPYSVAIAPSGSYAYVAAGFGGTVTIINTTTGNVIGTINAVTDGPAGIAFSPTGTYAYLSNYNRNNAQIVNTATNTVTGTISTESLGEVTDVALAPAGSYAYLANFTDIVIANTATHSVAGTITAGMKEPQGIAIHPSGTYAYAVDYYGYLSVINTSTSNVVTTISNGILPYALAGLTGVAFAPSGRYAYVANGGASNVVVVNTTSNTITASIVRGFNVPIGLAFSPDGSYAYVVNQGSGNVVVVDTATDNVIGAMPSGFNVPYGIAIAPSGSYGYVSNCNYYCTGQLIPNNVVIINTGASLTTSASSMITVR